MPFREFCAAGCPGVKLPALRPNVMLEIPWEKWGTLPLKLRQELERRCKRDWTNGIIIRIEVDAELAAEFQRYAEAAEETK